MMTDVFLCLIWSLLLAVTPHIFIPSLFFISTQFTTLPFASSYSWCRVHMRTWDRSFEALDSFMIVRWGSNPRVPLCSRPCSSKWLCKKSEAHMQPVYEEHTWMCKQEKCYVIQVWSDLTFSVVAEDKFQVFGTCKYMFFRWFSTLRRFSKLSLTLETQTRIYFFNLQFIAL